MYLKNKIEKYLTEIGEIRISTGYKFLKSIIKLLTGCVILYDSTISDLQ